MPIDPSEETERDSSHANTQPEEPEQGPGDTGETVQVRDSDVITGPLGSLAEEAGDVTIPLSTGPHLSEDTIVDERYQIVSFLGDPHGANTYRVIDLKGYSQCWACGSSASQEGDIYCVECGAQLSGRYYRLQEFAKPAQSPDSPDNQAQIPAAILPQAIVENVVAGVTRVYDMFEGTGQDRIFIVWEEVYGYPLSKWLPATEPLDVPISPAGPGSSVEFVDFGEPQEEQTLAWLAQTADILAGLHDQGIVGCNLKLNNLIVQPGDRIVLLDPYGCHSVIEEGFDSKTITTAKFTDVRNLASELRRWYAAVREEPYQPERLPSEEQGADEEERDIEAVEAPEAALSRPADETTAPLKTLASPAVILSKAQEGAYPSADEFAQAIYNLYEASRPITNLQVQGGCVSDVGRVREINEDSVLVFETNVLEREGNLAVGLYVIADGMGGHQSGEVASSLAVRTIGAAINASLIAPLIAGQPIPADATTCAVLLQQAVFEANRRICELARERNSDLGTTLTAALIVGNQLAVANVGDSRTYLWHDHQLKVITRDHSLVAQLVAAGQIEAGDIYTHPRRNEIFRALGDSRLVADEVDTFSHKLEAGDGVLLCSDGLWDFVRDPIIEILISEVDNGDPQTICKKLVHRANTAGGEDNISVIFVRIIPSKVAEQ